MCRTGASSSGHVPANRRLGVDDRCALQQQAVLDLVNTDIAPHVYGAFDKYIILDTKLHYEPSRNLSFDFGIDNVLNEQYFLFHPFPGRTYVVAGRYRF